MMMRKRGRESFKDKRIFFILLGIVSSIIHTHIVGSGKNITPILYKVRYIFHSLISFNSNKYVPFCFITCCHLAVVT